MHLSSAASPPFLPSEKQCSENACVLVRQNKVCVTFNMHKQSEKYLYQIQQSIECAGVGTCPERRGKSNCELQEGRLMMIDKHWLYLTPTHDYAVFIYPPVALSPSALFG